MRTATHFSVHLMLIFCGPRWAASTASFCGLLVGKMRLSQIELAFDVAPCLILKHTSASQLINAPPFGSDQKKLGLLTKLRAPSMAIMAVTSNFRVFEPVFVVSPERLNDLFNEIAFGGKLIKALNRGLDPLPASLILFDCVSVSF